MFAKRAASYSVLPENHLMILSAVSQSTGMSCDRYKLATLRFPSELGRATSYEGGAIKSRHYNKVLAVYLNTQDNWAAGELSTLGNNTSKHNSYMVPYKITKCFIKPAPYSGGLRFDFRLGDRLYLYRDFAVLLSPSKQIATWFLKNAKTAFFYGLPSSLFTIILTFEPV